MHYRYTVTWTHAWGTMNEPNSEHLEVRASGLMVLSNGKARVGLDFPILPERFQNHNKQPRIKWVPSNALQLLAQSPESLSKGLGFHVFSFEGEDAILAARVWIPLVKDPVKSAGTYLRALDEALRKLWLPFWEAL